MVFAIIRIEWVVLLKMLETVKHEDLIGCTGEPEGAT